MRIRSSIAALVILCAGTAAHAANPLYESWAKHKPGTVVTTKTVTDAAGNKSEMENTWTLKEVTAEKVVVEMKGSMVVMGNKIDQPATNMEFKAADAAPTEPPAGPDSKKPDVKTSEESVTVAGKEYNATVTEVTSEMAGMKTVSKTWTSNDIPGTMLKMESKSEGTMAMSTTMEVTSVEVK